MMAFGDITARVDQIHAEHRGQAQLAASYYRALLDADVPHDLASTLTADWSREWWRVGLADIGTTPAE